MNELFNDPDLDQQILENEQLLEELDIKDSLLSKYRRYRILFFVLMLFSLLGATLFYFFKYKKMAKFTPNKNTVLISKDSLTIYKNGYFKHLEDLYPTATDDTSSETSSLEDEKVVYSVQIGAFKNFDLTSKGLLHLSEFKDTEYNKLSLGNYTTYSEALVLKDSLMKLGFKDCFLTAKSFGKDTNIREALLLSNEQQFLEQ